MSRYATPADLANHGVPAQALAGIGIVPPVLGTCTATAGTLPAGTYGFRVTSLDANGRSAPSAEATITLTGPGGVLIPWPAVPGATGYEIYGRAPGAELFLATVGQVVSWVDTGALTPAGALPAVATSPTPAQRQQAALDAASTYADAYLDDKFTLPILTPSPDLVVAVCAIAGWNLLRVRGFNPEDGANVAIRYGYEDAVKWLRDVAAGRITPQLVDSSGAAVGTLGDPYVLQPQLSQTLTDQNGLPAMVAGTPTSRGF